MSKSLISGKPFSVIFLFAMPMLLGNLFQQFYNIVDSMIVGQFLGKDALAAVGSSFSVVTLVMSVAIGISTGCSVVISQFYGADAKDKIRRSIMTNISFVCIVGLVLTVAGLFCAKPLLVLMQTPPEILEDSLSYLVVMLIGNVFLFLYNALATCFNALGDSKTPLIFLIIASILNIGLDLLFVVTFQMGVAGAAWATIIAQGVSAILSVFALFRKLRGLGLENDRVYMDFQILRTMVRLAIPSTLQRCIISIGSLFVQGLINSYGSTVMAGFTSGEKLYQMIWLPIFAFSTALSTFTGQNIGAGNQDRVKKGVWSTFWLNTIACVILALLTIIFGKPMLSLFVNSDAGPEVIRIAFEYLLINVGFSILQGLMWTGNGVLRGAGDMVPVMMGSLVNLTVRVVFAYILAAVIGSSGIWWSIPIGWAFGTAICMGRYLSGKWKTKNVI